MYRLIVSIVCDAVIVLSLFLSSYYWVNDHDNITMWLYHLLDGILFAIISVRFDKDE